MSTSHGNVTLSGAPEAEADVPVMTSKNIDAAKGLLRVLLIEDSEDDAELVLRALRRGFETASSRVDTYEAAREALFSHPWDVVLTDHAMPNFSSAGALELLQELHLELPCVVVSGAIGEEAAVSLMQKGAADYVNKGKLARLGPAVTRALREAEARRARAEAEEALARERDFLKTVLDNITDGIVVSDEGGRTVMFNHAAREFHGQPVKPVPADAWADVYDLFESDGVTRLSQERVPLYRALRGERVREAEMVIKAEGRARRVVSANAQRIADAAGRTLGAGGGDARRDRAQGVRGVHKAARGAAGGRRALRAARHRGCSPAGAHGRGGRVGHPDPGAPPGGGAGSGCRRARGGARAEGGRERRGRR